MYFIYAYLPLVVEIILADTFSTLPPGKVIMLTT